jgi:hypothetical protein
VARRSFPQPSRDDVDVGQKDGAFKTLERLCRAASALAALYVSLQQQRRGLLKTNPLSLP